MHIASPPPPNVRSPKGHVERRAWIRVGRSIAALRDVIAMRVAPSVDLANGVYDEGFPLRFKRALRRQHMLMNLDIPDMLRECARIATEFKRQVARWCGVDERELSSCDMQHVIERAEIEEYATSERGSSFCRGKKLEVAQLAKLVLIKSTELGECLQRGDIADARIKHGILHDHTIPVLLRLLPCVEDADCDDAQCQTVSEGEASPLLCTGVHPYSRRSTLLPSSDSNSSSSVCSPRQPLFCSLSLDGEVLPFSLRS